MAKLVWDEIEKREYETGVSNVVLYPMDSKGKYGTGVAWNGVTQIDESPSGAESSPLYADNIEYFNLMSAEKHAGTINAYSYPDEFEKCDGSANLVDGVEGILVGQQTRSPFGLAYKTLKGNYTESTDYGYVLHLVYGAKASPSSKSHSTVNESPEAVTMSWSYSATAIEIPGMKPSATITLDSTKVDTNVLNAVEDALFGTEEKEPMLPTPAELITLINTATETV